MANFLYYNNATIDLLLKLIPSNGTLDTYDGILYCRSYSGVQISASYRRGYLYLKNTGQRDYDYLYTHPISSINDGKFHHIAITVNTSHLFSLYLDGKYLGGATCSFRADDEIGLTISSSYRNCVNICNYRISKGVRWTEDFISPYSELFGYKYLYNNENNIYGINK